MVEVVELGSFDRWLVQVPNSKESIGTRLYYQLVNVQERTNASAFQVTERIVSRLSSFVLFAHILRQSAALSGRREEERVQLRSPLQKMASWPRICSLSPPRKKRAYDVVRKETGPRLNWTTTKSVFNDLSRANVGMERPLLVQVRGSQRLKR